MGAATRNDEQTGFYLMSDLPAARDVARFSANLCVVVCNDLNDFFGLPATAPRHMTTAADAIVASTSDVALSLSPTRWPRHGSSVLKKGIMSRLQRNSNSVARMERLNHISIARFQA